MPQDWLEMFLHETRDLQSPEIFRLWAGITTISGICERKVWTLNRNGECYPNLYTVLVGQPSSGKSLAIKAGTEALGKLRDLHIASNSVTKASFTHELERSVRMVINGHTDPSIFSSLFVPSREMGVLVPKYDTDFLSTLNDIFDNPPKYTAPRVTTKSVSINKPNITILAGATPDYVGNLMPESAWGEGFASRLIFIYGEPLKAKPGDDMFDLLAESELDRVQQELKPVFDLYGEFEWEEDARQEINNWVNSGMEPIPTHSKLKFYCGRRPIHLMKLSMISALSNGHGLTVKLNDFNRAKQWLLQAEVKMPDVFKAISQKSDAQLIQDLHYEMYQAWASIVREKRQPIHEGIMYEWLSKRIPSGQVKNVFDLAVKSGAFKETLPGCFTPRPLGEVNIKGV